MVKYKFIKCMFLLEQVRALCRDNIHCQYDYMITLDKTLAEDTLKVQAWMQQQSDESKTGKLQMTF